MGLLYALNIWLCFHSIWICDYSKSSIFPDVFQLTLLHCSFFDVGRLLVGTMLNCLIIIIKHVNTIFIYLWEEISYFEINIFNIIWFCQSWRACKYIIMIMFFFNKSILILGFLQYTGCQYFCNFYYIWNCSNMEILNTNNLFFCAAFNQHQ